VALAPKEDQLQLGYQIKRNSCKRGPKLLSSAIKIFSFY